MYSCRSTNFFLITVNITKSLNPRCVLPPCLLLCPQKKKKTLTQKNLDSIEVQYFVSSTISSAKVFWYSFAYRKGITKLRQFRISTFIKRSTNCLVYMTSKTYTLYELDFDDGETHRSTDLKWDKIYTFIISTNFLLTRAARTLHFN